MIQDVAPHQYRNEYKPEKPEGESVLLCYKGNQILVKETEEGISFLTFREAVKYREDLYENVTYLFSIDGQPYYLPKSFDFLPEGYTFQDTTYFRTAKPKHLSFAAITGWQLYRWYDTRRFCGRCGKELVHDEKERMMRCPECGLMEFPKICPAVIVGVVNGNKILMSKYAGRSFKKYALIAGFNEIGETIEETVRREVMEEVGLKVKNIRYYKSQPWSFSDTLLMGFFCELDGEETITLDREELALAEWFDREEMPVKAENLSLTNEMMMAFKNGEWK